MHDQRRIRALLEVAHAAWHLMDDSGEIGDDVQPPDIRDLYLHSAMDHQRLSDALDELEDSGWDPHPDDRIDGDSIDAVIVDDPTPTPSAVSAADKLRGALAADAEPGPTRTVSLDVLAELIADYDRATMPNTAGRPLVGPAEMLDRGYVMELNRRFLHPLGLALAVNREKRNADGSFPVQLWDYRDDPEGFLFADLSDDAAGEKFLQVQNELRDKSTRRMHVLHGHGWLMSMGAIVQKVGSVMPAASEERGSDG